MFSVSPTTRSALSSERNHLMQIELSSWTVVPLLELSRCRIWLKWLNLVKQLNLVALRQLPIRQRQACLRVPTVLEFQIKYLPTVSVHIRWYTLKKNQQKKKKYHARYTLEHPEHESKEFHFHTFDTKVLADQEILKF